MKKQTHSTHITHHVVRYAPKRSDIQPPIARNTPPGKEKQAARKAAVFISKPYSPTKYLVSHKDKPT